MCYTHTFLIFWLMVCQQCWASRRGEDGGQSPALLQLLPQPEMLSSHLFYQHRCYKVSLLKREVWKLQL